MKHLLAAVDLGSNSFRLSIGRVAEQNGAKHIYQIDRLKETVRLAAGLDASKNLNQEAIDRAVELAKRALAAEHERTFTPAMIEAIYAAWRGAGHVWHRHSARCLRPAIAESLRCAPAVRP